MSDVTRILSQINDGDPLAAGRLLPLVYEELRKLATAKMAQEEAGQTLQATALVHEAYLRLVGSKPVSWENRAHFFAIAARLREDISGAIDASGEPITEVLLDAESIYDIDSTGAQILLELLHLLDQRGVALVMARVRTEIRDELAAAGIEKRLGAGGIYLEVDDAVRDYVAGRPGAHERN